MPTLIADRRTGPRRLACGLALMIALGASAALAQDDEDEGGAPAASPIVVQIDGPCVLTVDGKDLPCRGVAYMVFPATGRIDFAAITETSGYAFSGDEDENEEGQYALSLDSVIGPASGRVEAEGECEMVVAADRRTVTSLQCEATTGEGEMTLRASGPISTGGDTDDQDEDEGDEDD